tara:strand:+ start:1874 stop:2017 length:144 start_codon:yes stop_codon:yes gene_type:complete
MKYYKVPRFVKIQEIENKDKNKVESDWVEVNKDGSELSSKNQKKGEK